MRWTAGLVLLVSMVGQAQSSVKEPDAFKRADEAIQKAIEQRNIPGAVLIAGTSRQIVYRKAYGSRAVAPTTQPMTEDTIFDLASLSKPVGCATSVMKLLDDRKISVSDPVSKYLPEFTGNAKEAVTIEQLLLHRGGLVADNPLKDYDGTPAESWQKICDLKLKYEPGTKFEYTDVGFIVLGKLVEKVSGSPLNEFAAREVFAPLKMTDASYLPRAELRARIAPTEKRNGEFICGEVHDPRAYRLGGVAGHAGLFGTADDVARWCQMLIREGELDGTRVLSAATVSEMIKPRCLADGSNCRGYGVDIATGYSSARGDRFAKMTTFGHTGFTGTSFWIDPKNDCFVVLLTNRVHPDGKGDVKELRRAVATAVANAFLGTAAP
jgi:CubicO group peptidase (beta-lactamase class C family)